MGGWGVGGGGGGGGGVTEIFIDGEDFPVIFIDWGVTEIFIDGENLQ